MTVDKSAILRVAREQELSAIYQSVPGIFFYVAVEADGEFRFLSISDAWLDATGLTREQVVGSLVRDIIPPPSREMVLNQYRQAILTGQTVRWEETSEYPAGWRYGEVAVMPLYDEGVATHLLGIVHDITERKQAELDLQDRQRQQERTFRLLLETATQGILSVDAAGLIVMANATTERMFGWAPGELIGKSVEQLVPSAIRGPAFRAPCRVLWVAAASIDGRRFGSGGTTQGWDYISDRNQFESCRHC